MQIKVAVFPVAGLGTRFLPASKVVPKEMLPVLDKPLIHYAVTEAIEAGCDTLVFVTNRYKHAIADYFDKSYELESKLENAGKHDLLGVIRNILPQHVRAVFVTQPEAMGLGHAVLCARSVVGDQPFAVMLPDDLIWTRGQGCLTQMVQVADQHGASVIAVENVPREHTDRYGIVSSQKVDEHVERIIAVVEKPKPAAAPSTLGIVGRYVLDARIFEILEGTPKGAGGEIQLTDAIAKLIEQKPVLACRFVGRRFDCGSRVGMVQAAMHLALEDDELRPHVLAMIRNSDHF